MPSKCMKATTDIAWTTAIEQVNVLSFVQESRRETEILSNKARFILMVSRCFFVGVTGYDNLPMGCDKSRVGFMKVVFVEKPIPVTL